MRIGTLLKTLVCVGIATAYPNFKDIIPNGNGVPHPCKANYVWHGVGHNNPLGGGSRNQFGLDFKAAGTSWTPELCRKDSDGDGRTNGEELGDPECIWKQGDFPSRLTDITHPGVCTLSDGSVCDADKGWVDCQVEDGLKNCDVIKEPDTLNTTIRFPETAVPAEETTYSCMIFNLPSDQVYHLMAYEPYIDNEMVMHHILIYGCDPNEDPVPDEQLNTVTKCGMSAASNCNQMIGLWAVGFTGYCIDGPMGFRIGQSGFKQAALEFHWNNPQLVSNWKDSSGVTLYYTPKLRDNDAGIMMTGQEDLEIPPGQQSYTVVGKCHSECSRKLIQAPINIFWATNHMHYLGHEMNIKVYRDGVYYTELTNDVIYNYDSPVEKKYSTAVQVLPGDEIVTTCKFKSLSRPKTTFFGDATSDEMCFGFLAFYPAANMPFSTCTAWKDISICNLWVTREHEDCKWSDFMNVNVNETKRVKDEVMANCKPFGNCLSECKATLEVLFAEHPCMKGDVYELIRQMSLQWDNKEMLAFIVAADSCKAEIAADAYLQNLTNNNVNGSGRLDGISSLLLLTLIMYIMNT
ncbi:tyramine beta-hydroxylase-like isoform X1 [Mytilus edulis]|uniref:tyramine beta-hydroxylase-like isoform X1 n=1 Tax=Mytilus edulis TaxID=6550 RepID=UPI0039EEEEAF